MDRLELMHLVVTAVEAGSFSAAARKLGLPLTTVSRKIAALERHLNSQLFTRATRRIGLTDAGTDYVLGCRRILQEVREMERAVSGEYTAPKGDLWITAPLVFGRLHILPIVSQFLQVYPEVDVKLSLSDRVVNLLEEPVDLALRIGNLPDSSLVATRLGTIRQVTCASPDYLKRRGTPKDPEALAGHDCVTFEGLMSPQEWYFEGGRSQRPVAIRSRLVVSTAEAAIDAAIAGVGLTRVLSYQVARPVAAGTLKIVLKDYESSPRPVSFTYRSGTLLPLKLRAFLDYATPRLREALGGGS
jgi:DNA-binding transcriptional LysR family regulator